MYRMAAQMKRDKKNVCGTNFVQNAFGDIKINEVDVRSRWREYFSVLLNEENPNHFEDVPATEGPIEDITLEEVRKAIKGMKNHKATGPSGIYSDMINLAGDTGTLELHKVFQKIIQEETCPQE